MKLEDPDKENGGGGGGGTAHACGAIIFAVAFENYVISFEWVRQISTLIFLCSRNCNHRSSEQDGGISNM